MLDPSLCPSVSDFHILQTDIRTIIKELSTIAITRSGSIPTRYSYICIGVILIPPRTLVEDCIQVAVEASKTYLTSHIGDTIELSECREALPLETNGGIVSVLRTVAIAVWSLIVGINHTITIVVDDVIVTNQTVVLIHIMGRRTIQVINVIQVTIAQPSLGLIDGITSLLQVGWSHTWVILDEHLVLGMGHIEVTPKTKTIGKGLVELYFPLITSGANLTQIGCRC